MPQLGLPAERLGRLNPLTDHLAHLMQCSMILNGNIFQTAPSSEFRTGSSLEKNVLCQLTNSELDLVWNSELDLVWNSEVGSVWNWE